MQVHLLFLAALSIGTTAFAQTHQQFEMQGIRTSYTDRALVGRGVGEVLQGFHSSHHRGLAENGGQATPVCTITQIKIVHQDQNSDTVEGFDLVVRKGDDTNGPTAGSTGLYGSITGLKTPQVTPGRVVAWSSTYTLTPAAYINVDYNKFFALGLNFTTPQPNLWADGHGLHTSWGTSGKPDMGSWTEDHQSTTQDPTPDHAWNLVGTATKAVHSRSFPTWRIGFSTHGACLQLGCGGGYGMGGMFPKTSTSSSPLAYTGRVRLGSAYNGAVVVVIASPGGYFPVSIPMGPGAHLHINPSGIVLFFGPQADANGQSIVPLASFVPDLKQALPRFTLPFQAAGESPTAPLKLTNVQVMEPH